MAKKSKKTDNFKEFKYEGKEFTYSGRIYPDSAKESKECDITPMSLTLNDVITIKGCKLMESKKNTWIAFPAWEDKKGDWNSYVYVDKEFSKEEIDKVAEAVAEAIAED